MRANVDQAKENAKYGLYIHILVDQTEEMGRQHVIVEKRLDRLFYELRNRSAGGYPLYLRAIGMGRASAHIVESGTHTRFHLPAHPGCDLERSLQLVAAAVQVDPNVRHKVFILLSQEPGGRWHSLAADLRSTPTVELLPIVFGPDELEEESLALLGSGLESVKRLDQVGSGAIALAMREILQAVEQAIAVIEWRFRAPNGESMTAWAEKASGKASPSAESDGEGDAGAASPEMTPAPEMTRGQESPPPVNQEGVATLWKEIEPDESLPFRVPHLVHELVEARDQWRLFGASRRGKLHAHKGIFREDAFALASAAGWVVAIVADGAGSCPLSRVGAKVASEQAAAMICTMLEQEAGVGRERLKALCQQALGEGLEAAWEAIQRQAQEMGQPISQFSTTFLALAYHPATNLAGVVQIGDGLIAAEMESGKLRILAEPDIGTTASMTSFLTSKYWQEWQGRIQVVELVEKPRMLMVMCDGVSDDFIPYDAHLPTLVENLKLNVCSQPQPDSALANFLNYEKRGSFDDRTLVAAYRGAAAPAGNESPNTVANVAADSVVNSGANAAVNPLLDEERA